MKIRLVLLLLFLLAFPFTSAFAQDEHQCDVDFSAEIASTQAVIDNLLVEYARILVRFDGMVKEVVGDADIESIDESALGGMVMAALEADVIRMNEIQSEVSTLQVAMDTLRAGESLCTARHGEEVILDADGNPITTGVGTGTDPVDVQVVRDQNDITQDLPSDSSEHRNGYRVSIDANASLVVTTADGTETEDTTLSLGFEYYDDGHIGLGGVILDGGIFHCDTFEYDRETGNFYLDGVQDGQTFIANGQFVIGVGSDGSWNAAFVNVTASRAPSQNPEWRRDYTLTENTGSYIVGHYRDPERIVPCETGLSPGFD